LPNAFYAFLVRKIASSCNSLPNLVQCSIFKKYLICSCCFTLVIGGFSLAKIAVCWWGMHPFIPVCIRHYTQVNELMLSESSVISANSDLFSLKNMFAQCCKWHATWM